MPDRPPDGVTHGVTDAVAAGTPDDPPAAGPQRPGTPALLPWDELAEQAAGCTRCRLHEGRGVVVFGDGPPDADLMMVGEGPGRAEDLKGLPFAGALGNVIANVLSDGGLTREEVYLTTVVKCRPPGERPPRDDEIATCAPYLWQQIAHVDPQVVLGMGEVAASLLLGRPVPLDKLAGYRFDVRGRVVIPTYHPALVLRGNPRASRGLRRDVRTASAVLAGRLPDGVMPAPAVAGPEGAGP